MERLRVLVVENDAFIAYALATDLRALGHAVVGPAQDLPEVLGLIVSSIHDVALLDVDLGGADSVPAADAIAARRTPFAFLSDSRPGLLPARFATRPFLAKPYRQAELAGLLRRLAAER